MKDEGSGKMPNDAHTRHLHVSEDQVRKAAKGWHRYTKMPQPCSFWRAASTRGLAAMMVAAVQ